MLTIYDRMSQSHLIWGKNMKMEKNTNKNNKTADNFEYF